MCTISFESLESSAEEEKKILLSDQSRLSQDPVYKLALSMHPHVETCTTITEGPEPQYVSTLRPQYVSTGPSNAWRH